MADRTGEFQGAVNVFRPTILSNGTAANLSSSPPGSLPPRGDALGRPPPRPEKSEFFQLASSVAVGFEGTAKLIDRLKKLVGRKGFSNNPAAEISDVMKLFEGDMAGLQKDIATLQRHAEGKSRGSPPANCQRGKHCQHIVATLQNSAQEHTKAFRDALLQRAAIEKQQTDRQRIFSHSRGVAPATQLDYPLFGGNSGIRNRAARRRADPPPLPGPALHSPQPPPLRERDSGLPSPPAFGGGSVGSNPAFVTPTQSSSPWMTTATATPWMTTATAMPRPGPGFGAGGSGVKGEAAPGALSPSGGRSPLDSASKFSEKAVGAGRLGGRVGGYGGDGRGGGEVPLPPTERFRAGNGAFGLRKRLGHDDEIEGEEEARRAAWQVQVQEDARNRVEESSKVEKMIGDLGQMFSRFSTMVAAQEEVVIRIEDDMEAAHAFAAEGQSNLAKYYRVMSGNRGIIIKVFLLLILFIWVFLGVMR